MANRRSMRGASIDLAKLMLAKKKILLSAILKQMHVVTNWVKVAEL